MKELFNYVSQPRSYADSYGFCLVELENQETLEDVINTYVKPQRAWYEVIYSNPIEISEYKEEKRYHDRFKENIIHTGKLVLLETFRNYLD